MRQSIPLCLILLVVVALASAACSEDLTTTPTEPTPDSKTENFSDTITTNGARTHPFTVDRPGAVTATLQSLSPDNTITIGLSLGTWNGQSCQTVIAKDNAVVGNSVTGTASASGTLCVRVYDAVGAIAEPTTYDVQVVHF